MTEYDIMIGRNLPQIWLVANLADTFSLAKNSWNIEKRYFINKYILSDVNVIDESLKPDWILLNCK